MSPPTDSGIAAALTDVGAISRPTAVPREFQPLICGVVLLMADCAAMPAALFSVAGCIACVSPTTHMLQHAREIAWTPELATLLVAIVAYLSMQGRYTQRKPLWRELHVITVASLWASGAAAVFALLAARTTHAVPMLGTLVMFPALATITSHLARQTLQVSGLWTMPVVVVGEGSNVTDTTLAMGRALGYRVVACVDPDVALMPPGANRLGSLLQRYRARRLIIALEGTAQREVVERALCERVPFTLALLPKTVPAFAWEAISILSHDATFLSFRDPLSQPVGRTAKAAVDVAGALALLIVLSPAFLLLTLLCRLDGGPALFAHRRVGAHGRPFHCLKFRTMVVDSDRVLTGALAADPALAEEWRLSRKLTKDPRITRVGRFLRNTSLDELPQLINVLRLEMSLVGPRPIVESEIAFYGTNIAQYYATRPGLTGLWQVSGRSNTSYAKRVQLDVWYVNNWTIWNDFVVLLRTIPAVIRRQGAC